MGYNINSKVVVLEDGNSTLLVHRKAVEAIAIQKSDNSISFSLKSGERVMIYRDIDDDLNNALIAWMDN